MKVTLTGLALLLFVLTKAQFSLGVMAEPTLNIATVGSQPEALSDTLKLLKQRDLNISFGIEIKKQIDRYASFSLIPGYYQSNFLVVKENLQFLDVVHPELREIRDFSQASQKNAYLHYRQKYIGLQALYAKRLKLRNLPSKVFVEIGGGLGLHYLWANDVKVRTEGFAIDEKYINIIKQNTGFTPSIIAINAIGFADLSYELTPKTNLVSGFKINIPLSTSANAEPLVRIYTPALRLGIRFTL
jgi:hypothetical protein